MSALRIPDVGGMISMPTAAARYCRVGWYVGPLRLTGEHKHAGSVLGTSWPDKTVNRLGDAYAWFALPDGTPRTDRGIFLHVGRSGALALDVDRPEHLPELLRAAITELRPPFQGTRAWCCPPFDPYREPFGRGH